MKALGLAACMAKTGMMIPAAGTLSMDDDREQQTDSCPCFLYGRQYR
jgi:hypothetical protein